MPLQENILKIKQAEDLILRNRLKQALNLQEQVALLNKNDFLKDKINLIRESYNYLLHFFTQGTQDPQRQQIFNELKLNALHLNDQLHRYLLLEEAPFNYYQYILQDLQLNFDIKTPDTDSLEYFFASIWLYPSLTEQDYQSFKEFFASDVHWVIKAMAVSALTLSLITFFDEKKIILLFDLVHAEEYQIWERALVGLMIVLYLYDNRLELYPDIINRIKVLPEINAATEKLKSVLIQIIRSAKETAILQEKFEKEIMPEMVRLAPELEEKLNLEELMSEDMLDEDENPDWEKIFKGEEEFFEKMSEFSMLQLEGADIMHSAFSKMKFFDFFRSLPNWFMPFFPGNQQIIGYLEQTGFEPGEAEMFVDVLADSHYICNSDKYSFALQMKYLPQEQAKNAIEIFKFEANSVKEVRETEVLTDILGPSRFVIIQYVQDLYRFFKLYPALNVIPQIFDLPLDFHNKKFFRYLGDAKLLRELGEFYFAKKFYDEAIEIFTQIAEQNKDGEIYEKLGFAYQKRKDYRRALEYYMQAKLYETHPKKWLTQKIAYTSMKTGNYKQAIEYYESLLTDDPENQKLLINIGNCYLHLGDYDKALQYYFKVEYYSPGNPKVLRPIGWIAFRQGDLEKAKKFYNKVLETKPKPIDFITAGHIYFASGQIGDALELYKKAKATYEKLSDYEKDFFQDAEILEKYNLDKVSINLMFEASV